MTTYSEAVEKTITAGEQIHHIINGTATTEVTVEDGSKIPSIRKALIDNFYFKDPIAWQVGQTENIFNQLRQFTDGTWWYAPSATASNPVSMGSTPVGDVLWKLYPLDPYLRNDLNSISGGSLVRLSNNNTAEEEFSGSGILRGNSGVNYSVSGCAVRRDTTLSPAWSLVSDSAHIPINTTGVTDGVDVNIQYQNGTKIGTLVAGPDERFAADGVLVGASVAANNANISLGAPCQFYIDFDSSNNIVFDTKFFDISGFSVSIAASGLITITHPQRRLMQSPMCTHTTGGSFFEHLIPHFVNPVSSGTTSLYLVGEAEGLISYNGSNWGISSSSWFSGDMSFSYDNPTGVLTVTHPQVLGSAGINITPYDNEGDIVCHLSMVTGTGFKVKFRKLDGTVPSLSSALGFYFSRGLSAIRKTPSGRLNVFLGHVQVNCNHVNYPNGNFWYAAIMQD